MASGVPSSAWHRAAIRARVVPSAKDAPGRDAPRLEERDGVAVLIDVETLHDHDLLERHQQAAAAGGEHRHLRARREHPLDDGRDAGDQVLAVVEDDQGTDGRGSASTSASSIGRPCRSLTPSCSATAVATRPGSVTVTRSTKKAPSGNEVATSPATGDGQPGLAHPAPAEDGDQAELLYRVGDRLPFGDPADEGGERDRQRRRTATGRRRLSPPPATTGRGPG